MRNLLKSFILLMYISIWSQSPKVDQIRFKELTTIQMNSLTRVQEGSVIFNSDTKSLWSYKNDGWVDLNDIEVEENPYGLKTNDLTSNYTFVYTDKDSLTITNNNSDLTLTIPADTYANGDVVLAESINATGNIIFNTDAINAPSIQTDTIYAVAGYQFRSPNVAYPIGRYKLYDNLIPAALDLPELVSYYSDESIQGATGSGQVITGLTDLKGSNNATSLGSPVLNEIILLGQPTIKEISFDGTDDYFSLGQPGNLNFVPGTDEFTIVIETGSGSPTTGVLVGKTVSNGGLRQYQFGVENNQSDIYLNTGGSSTISDTNYNLAQPSLLIFRVTTSTMQARHNGLNGAAHNRSLTNTTNTDITIGARMSDGNTSPTFFYNGTIRKIAFIAKAISDLEALAIENELGY